MHFSACNVFLKYNFNFFNVLSFSSGELSMTLVTLIVVYKSIIEEFRNDFKFFTYFPYISNALIKNKMKS